MFASPYRQPLAALATAIVMVGCTLDIDALRGSMRDGGAELDGSTDPDAAIERDAGDSGMEVDAGPECATVAHIAVGRSHSCAVTTGGALYCWGANGFGQLGLGNQTASTTPSYVGDGFATVAVSLGDGVQGNATTCAIRTGGELLCWGQASAALGLGPTVVEDVLEPELVDEPAVTSGWFSVTMGRSHVCAMVNGASGTLYCWGDSPEGQLGQGDTASQHLPFVHDDAGWLSVDAGADHTCGIRRADGEEKLFCWGDSRASQAGYVEPDPKVRLSPTPIQRVLPDRTRENDEWRLVSAGGLHTIGLTHDRAMWGMGRGTRGQIGDGESVSHGVMQATGESMSQISAGASHTCGIDAAGGLYCWGANGFGQLGVGIASTELPSPGLVNAGPWLEVEAAADSTCAIRQGGALFCWGDNTVRQLGIEGDDGRTQVDLPMELCLR